ncbi:Uncharacterised protein [Klebsiella variicola]|nr:Uncharacterised protein [Klebsiella variicola]
MQSQDLKGTHVRDKGELLRIINVRWCLSATDAAFGQP